MSKIVAIKDVMDFEVCVYSASGRGNILFNVDYASKTDITSAAERITLRGGIGNFKQMLLDHSRDSVMAAMLPMIDIDALATKLGVTKTTGATTAVKMETLTTTGATPTITLASTPLSGTLKVYAIVAGTERDLGTEQTAGTPASTANTYSITGTTITLNATSGVAGTKIYVSYDYTSGANAERVAITASNFPAFITIRGRGFWDDSVSGRIPVSFVIHKAKVKPEFELTMAGDAATEFNFETDIVAVKNSSGVFEDVVITKLNDELA